MKSFLLFLSGTGLIGFDVIQGSPHPGILMLGAAMIGLPAMLEGAAPQAQLPVAPSALEALTARYMADEIDTFAFILASDQLTISS